MNLPERICKNCTKIIIPDKKRPIEYWNKRSFCNKKCQKELSLKKRANIICLICNKKFIPLRSNGKIISEKQSKTRKFCSYKCYNIHTSRIKKGKTSPMKGKKHTQESLDKMSIVRTGRPLSKEHIENIRKALRKFHKTDEKIILPKNKYGMSLESRKKLSIERLGKNNPMWKGGR